MKTSTWSEQLRERIAASDIVQRVWTRYESASPREQFNVNVAGGCLAVVLVVALILVPLHRYHSAARVAWQQQSETLAWMQANRARAAATAAVGTRPAGESLLSLASQGARRMGLTFKRSEPAGERGLNIWLEKVPFNQVIAWLGQLERESGVVASEFASTRRDEPGLVDVRVTLQD